MADPIIAIIGSAKDAGASAAAEDLGRELAKAKFRILVYASGADYLEVPIVRGYAASAADGAGAIEVRYPLHGDKPAFAEQATHAALFDWRPDTSPDWEVSFYQSLNDVDGVLLLQGGNSTLVSGLVAIGKRIAILALAAFDGAAANVWASLRPGRDLASPDEISLMARPAWSPELASECVAALKEQLARRKEEDRVHRLEQLRSEMSVTLHATVAALLFIAAIMPAACGLLAGSLAIPKSVVVSLLFLAPLFAGISGSTIRLVFDLRGGRLPLSRESTITTAALGLIAGGAAGVLFITAQAFTLGDNATADALGKLLPFVVMIGFTAGLTLDAVFRKLIASDVVDLSAIEARRRS
jgi:hypothetical protein